MSLETEKIFKDLQQYLESIGADTMDDKALNQAMDTFMKQYQMPDLPDAANLPKPEEVDDVFELLDLSHEAPTKKEAIAYLKRAKSLEKDNVDVKRLLITLETPDENKRFEKYQTAIKKAKKALEKEGWFDEDNKGLFWGILETRPYMRLLCDYVQDLISCERYRMALHQCLEMLELSENDNLGMRYIVIALYAILDDYEGARAFWESQSCPEGVQHCLPLSVAAYKAGQLKEAEKFLITAYKSNKNVWDFFGIIFEDDFDLLALEDLVADMQGYQFDDITEVFSAIKNLPALYTSAYSYFNWAVRVLSSHVRKA